MEKYTLKQKLGSGSYAEVYYCIENATGREFAMKMLDKKKAGRKGLAQAYAEVDILGCLKHPNIIGLHDSFDTQAHLCLVLELVRGGELFDQIVALRHYTEDTAARLVRNLCLTLKYMNDQGVAHRDIKPENLMLSEKVTSDTMTPEMLSNVKLVDFGFAAQFRDKPFSDCLGTPNFIAPEVLQYGLFKEIPEGYDEKADMWSTGVLAYILLCGYPPFHDQSRTELFKKICHGRFVFHAGTATRASVWDKISQSAKHFVTQLLQKDPKMRFSPAQALEHPWLAAAAPDVPLPEAQSGIENLLALKMKGAVYGIGAATRLMYLQRCKQLNMKANTGLVAMLTEMCDHNASTLDLRNNYLGKRGMETLMSVLPKLQIQTLVLVDNQIDNDVLTVLIPALRQHPTIETVDLRQNPISLMGARALLGTLQQNPRITAMHLDFSDCKSYERKIAEQLARNSAARSSLPPSAAPPSSPPAPVAASA